MGDSPLSQEDFEEAVVRLKDEIGEKTEGIDLSAAYTSYQMLTGIFGAVNLKTTDRGDRRRVEMMPRFE